MGFASRAARSALLGRLLRSPPWPRRSPRPRAWAGPRIKDVADFEGVRENQLVGYGLVVGLAGTGD